MAHPQTLGSYMDAHIRNTPRLSQVLPFESYDASSQLFYNADSTGFVLLANPIVGANLQDQQQMAQFFRQNAHLSEGTSLQFLLFASPCIGRPLDYWLQVRKSAGCNKLFDKIAEQRVEFLKAKAFVDANDNLIRDYKVLISYTMPGHVTGAFDKQELLSFRKKLRAELKGLGVHSQILDAEGFIQEVGGILNMHNDVYPYQNTWFEHDSLSNNLTDTIRTYTVEPEQVLLNDGQTVCRSYTPSVWPKRWSLGFMDRLIGDCLQSGQSIGCPFLIHYGFFVKSGQGRAKAKALAKSETLQKALQNNMSKLVPNLADQYQESIEVAAELQSGGQTIISGLSFTLFSTPAAIHDHEQSLKRIWNQGGWVFAPCRYDHLIMLMSSLPMTWTLGLRKGVIKKSAYGMGTALLTLRKAKITATKEAQNLLPLLSEWKGQDAPGMPLVGRRGQLFFWNPFGIAFLSEAKDQQTEHNYNICIAGNSGSGKSFFMNDLANTVLGVGGKVVVLDMGRSFKKNCQIMQGRHLEFDVRYPISLNPFTHIPTGNSRDDIEERADMLALAGNIFQVMSSPKLGTTDLENSFIDQAIQATWKKYQNLSNVDTVREYLSSHKNPIAQDLGEKLSLFSSHGSFGHFFNGPADSNLKENLIVIETEGLRSHPTLMPVVVQLLVTQVNQEMAKGSKTRPFLIMIDEAWQLLSGKDTSLFISAATRIARKYRGSIVCATQHLTDYFKSEAPGATEAFNCSSWKVIMHQEDDVITSLKSHSQLQGFVDDEYKESLLRSIHSNPPHYSEAALFGPDIRGIVARLRVDHFSRLLYSTNPQEYQAIENDIKAGYSIEAAIERLMAQQQKDRVHA